MEAALSELWAVLQRIDGFGGFWTGWVMGDCNVCCEFGVTICNGLRENGVVLGTSSTAVAEDGKVFGSLMILDPLFSDFCLTHLLEIYV